MKDGFQDGRMQAIVSNAFMVLLLALMWAMTILVIFRRCSILAGARIYASGKDRGWQVGTTIFSLITGAPAIFFLVVAAGLLANGSVDWRNWLLTLTAILCFGNLAISLAPWRARTIITDRGIVYPVYATGGWYWRNIKGFDWSPAAEKNKFQLSVEIGYLGLKISIPLRGSFDGATRELLQKVLAEKIGRGKTSDLP